MNERSNTRRVDLHFLVSEVRNDTSGGEFIGWLRHRVMFYSSISFIIEHLSITVLGRVLKMGGRSGVSEAGWTRRVGSRQNASY